MKKSVTILSVISIIIAVLSTISFFAFLTFLWEPIIGIYSLSEDIIYAGPLIPTGKAIYIIGSLVISIILLVSSETREFIVIEILSMIFLSIIFPVLSWLFGTLQNSLVNSTGIINVSRLMITNNIITFPVGLMKLASALCLVTCGMRIADKVCLKKLLK